MTDYRARPEVEYEPDPLVKATFDNLLSSYRSTIDNAFKEAIAETKKNWEEFSMNEEIEAKRQEVRDAVEDGYLKAGGIPYKKTRKVKADYAVLEDTGEGTFKLVSTAKSLKAAKARLVSEKLSGEFLLVTLRGRVKASLVESVKVKAV